MCPTLGFDRTNTSNIPFVQKKELALLSTVVRPVQMPATTSMPVHFANPVVTTNLAVQSSKQRTTQLSQAPLQTRVSLFSRNKVLTPVKVDSLEMHLQGYDSNLKDYLIQGFTWGFRLGCTNEPSATISPNHQSILKFSKIVDEKLDTEKRLGRIAGPFESPPYEHFVCSPLAIIPRSVPGKFRLIHNLSSPHDNSVNLGIPPDMSAVQYDNIEVVIDLVKKFGHGSLMAKTDIEDAFRIIPINPLDYHLLGFRWRNKFYNDLVLTMGASSSCNIFNKFSSALKWIMLNKYDACGMSHILDDFFFIGPKKSEKCMQDLSNFLEVAVKLGVPIKKEKTEYPSTKIIIYGIEIDSVAMESRLPTEKLQKIRDKLNEVVRRKKVTLKTLQSLIGLLNFACCVICPGRAFLRRLIDLTCGVRCPNFYVRLNSEARADMQAWLTIISSFSGKSVFLPTQWSSSDSLG